MSFLTITKNDLIYRLKNNKGEITEAQAMEDILYNKNPNPIVIDLYIKHCIKNEKYFCDIARETPFLPIFFKALDKIKDPMLIVRCFDRDFYNFKPTDLDVSELDRRMIFQSKLYKLNMPAVLYLRELFNEQIRQMCTPFAEDMWRSSVVVELFVVTKRVAEERSKNISLNFITEED